MPNNAIKFYNYYFRYLWNAQDFTNLQDALASTTRGSMEGAYAGAVLNGLGCLRSSGRGVRVNPGIAVSPTGKLMYLSAFQNYTFSAPSGNPERALLVMRPKQTDSDPITSPTDPNATVYLKQDQGFEIVGIRGTPSATPAYPSKLDDDVILCGVYLDPSVNFDGNTDIDYSVRDMPMKNASGLDAHGVWDDRLRPFKNSYKSVGIKPAIQGAVLYMGENPTRQKPVGYSYVSATKKSLFPRGTFNDAQNVDTFLDFETGAISGGYTGSFTPVIPEAGKFQLATVAIDVTDKLVVFYPTPSFSYNSKSGVWFDINDGLADAPQGTKAICHVILTGLDGTTVADISIVDIRNPGNVVTSPPGAASGVSIAKTSSSTESLDKTYDGKTLLCDFSALADGTSVYLNLQGDMAGFKMTVKDTTGHFGRLDVRLGVANGATQRIEGSNANIPLAADFGAWTVKADETGLKYWLI